MDKNNEMENVKFQLLKDVEKSFPRFAIELEQDPDDEKVYYVRVFDVQDDMIQVVRNKVWDIIDSIANCDSGYSFIPSIVRCDDVDKYYPLKRAFLFPTEDEWSCSSSVHFDCFKGSPIVVMHNSEEIEVSGEYDIAA